MKFSIFSRNKMKSDEALLALYKQDNDMEVLGELYNRYLEMSMGLCMKYLKHVQESEDAVMEVFEIIVKRLPNHDVENFKPWLYRVVSNHCLDILRRKKRISEKEIEVYRVQSEEGLRHESESFSGELNEKEVQLNAMENCIEELKEQQRKSVQLFFIEKQSYETVAKALGITWSQTRSAIQNGKRNLKKCMEKSHEPAR